MASRRPIFSRIGDSTPPSLPCLLLSAASLSAAAQQSGPAPGPAASATAGPADGEAVATLAAAAEPAGGNEVLEEPGPEIEAYVTRLEAQLTLRDRLDHGEYTEAVPVAARLVELVAAHPALGPDAAQRLEPGAAHEARTTPGAGGTEAVAVQLDRLDAALAAG